MKQFQYKKIELSALINTWCYERSNIFWVLLLLFSACEFETVLPPEGQGNKIEVYTHEATDITRYTATLAGAMGNTYGRTVQDYGHCWGTLPEPDVSGNHTSFGSQTGRNDFESEPQDSLMINTLYYVRTWFKIDKVTVYGDQITFRTLPPEVPDVETVEVRNVGFSSARVDGRIDDKGGVAVVEYGVCWNTSGDPDKNDFKVFENEDIRGDFSFPVSGLDPNTTYYVRAFATNSVGTGYGDEVEFMTK